MFPKAIINQESEVNARGDRISDQTRKELGFKTLKSKQVIVYSYCACPKEERHEGSIQGVRDSDF